MPAKENFKTIKFTDKDYPFLLKETVLPPQLLYVRGGFAESDKNAVAIVGARIATSEGLKNAYELAFQLAGAGITIVSGLAQGIDTEAHRGALDAGGRTIAVLGTGVDVIYPSQNKKLAQRILDEKSGAIISEFSPGTPALPHHFPQRNRIISGLSLGTVVVEAREKSGALITANFALEQNREIFAIPGSISKSTSVGPNRLIKQGAKMVTDISDIIEELNLKLNSGRKPNQNGEINTRFDKLDANELKVVNILSLEPKTIEELIQENSFNVSQINTLVSMLELKGIVQKVGGKYHIK